MNEKCAEDVVDLPCNLSVIDTRMDQAIRDVLTLSLESQETHCDRALFALMTHIANNWKAISTLSNNVSDRDHITIVANPTTALLRCMYDAFIQMLYIVHDHSQAEELARRYLEYGTIEHYQYMKAITSGASPLSKRISASPKRQTSVKKIEEEYSKICRRVPRYRKRRQHWYDGTLYDLACTVGRKEEYTWYVSFSNSAIHAGPFAVMRGAIAPTGEEAIFAALPIVCQAANKLTIAMELVVSQKTRSWLDSFVTEFCNLQNKS